MIDCIRPYRWWSKCFAFSRTTNGTSGFLNSPNTRSRWRNCWSRRFVYAPTKNRIPVRRVKRSSSFWRWTRRRVRPRVGRCCTRWNSYRPGRIPWWRNSLKPRCRARWWNVFICSLICRKSLLTDSLIRIITIRLLRRKNEFFCNKSSFKYADIRAELSHLCTSHVSASLTHRHVNELCGRADSARRSSSPLQCDLEQLSGIQSSLAKSSVRHAPGDQ